MQFVPRLPSETRVVFGRPQINHNDPLKLLPKLAKGHAFRANFSLSCFGNGGLGLGLEVSRLGFRALGFKARVQCLRFQG